MIITCYRYYTYYHGLSPTSQVIDAFDIYLAFIN